MTKRTLALGPKTFNGFKNIPRRSSRSSVQWDHADELRVNEIDRLILKPTSASASFPAHQEVCRPS